MQLCVVAAEREELVVAALLRDPAVLEDDDLVGVADGAQAGSDGDHGAPLHDALERLDDDLFRLGVERRSRLVEDEDGRVAKDRAGDSNSPILILDEPTTALDTESEKVVIE